MKALEIAFLTLQFIILVTFLWVEMIITGIAAVVLLNIGVKLFNMWRLDPMERQEYRDQGGSGIWC